MNTIYLTTSEDDLKKAAGILQRGGLVAFPTETVYGLGGNALDPDASRRIYAAKGRPSDNPLIVHISELSQAEPLVRRVSSLEYPEGSDIPVNAHRLADAIWPGPMTMVLPKSPLVPKETTGGLDTVALRLPANAATLKLIEYAEIPVAGPSANISGRPSPTTWQHVRDDLDGRIDAVIKGEPCIGGIESTVVDMTEELPVILRPGLITPERISQVLQLPCSYDPAILGSPDPSLVPKAPGMKYRHYAPKAEMRLFRLKEGNAGKSADQLISVMNEEAEEYRRLGRNVEVLCYESEREAAEKLFADLRRLDQENADMIFAAALDQSSSIGFSVMNRMLKSAGYNIVEV
ncbi:MAG: threonylcarbamoyl-AMP synthase [Firmicutes bacterium]|nr:threonylcarbamoyl-AMP synthase [Bacillota bacterium]